MSDFWASIQSLYMLPFMPKVIITLIGLMVYGLLFYFLWIPQDRDAKPFSELAVASQSSTQALIATTPPTPLAWDDHWGTTTGGANGTIYLSALQIKARNVSNKEVALKDAFVTSGKTGQVTRMKANAGADGWITPSELNPIPPGAIVTVAAEFSPPQGLSARDFMLEWGIITLTALYDEQEYKRTFGEPETSKIFEGFGINPLGPHVSRRR